MMTTNSPFMTRRQFLRTGVIGGALAATVPAFLDQTLFRLEAAELARSTQRLHGKDAPILILMQLAGGNDGLNTVIPLENDHYRNARPRLGKVADTALSLNSDFGLHENLSGLKALYDEGMLSIVQGVGYPNPNRSHFRSTEIWHTAAPEGRKGGDGWVGRFFDNQCQGMPADTGISITGKSPQAFQGPSPLGITFRNPNEFRFADGIDEMSGASIGVASGQGMPNSGSALNFLERTDLDARVSSDRVQETLKKMPEIKTFPNSRIASDLSMIARLIGGGMSTRIYYLSHGGYDTHANQGNSHANLMRDLGNAQQAFWQEMKRQGNESRVRMLVFSEFGRRVAENGSAGTDHGAAAPVFVLGGGLKGGLHGTFPSLDPAHLHRGDMVHSTDFRSVYASVLQDHLQAEAAQVLGRSWETLSL